MEACWNWLRQLGVEFSIIITKPYLEYLSVRVLLQDAFDKDGERRTFLSERLSFNHGVSGIVWRQGHDQTALST